MKGLLCLSGMPPYICYPLFAQNCDFYFEMIVTKEKCQEDFRVASLLPIKLNADFKISKIITVSDKAPKSSNSDYPTLKMVA
jgi:hypothetical protein